MTTYRLQAEYMIKKHGLANAIELVEKFVREQPTDHFWHSVLNILNQIKEEN